MKKAVFYLVYLQLLVILLSVTIGLYWQSSLNSQCMKFHADAAVWTVDGVYCWRNVSGMFREYYKLDDLRAKHEGPKVDPTIRPTPNGFGL